jgi:hypothetical protein
VLLWPDKLHPFWRGGTGYFRECDVLQRRGCVL